MKKINWNVRRLNLNAMIRSREFEGWQSDKLGNFLCIEDPDRFNRIQEEAENGGDGSTHYETIMDWNEFLDSQKLPCKVADRISNEIATCYNWHESKGSLHSVIG